MANQIQHIYEARLQSELEARSPQTPRNHLLAATLEDLLEERKKSRSQEQLTNLAKKYNIDVARLENLARFVNTPNVDPESVVKTVDDDGTERVTMKVCRSLCFPFSTLICQHEDHLGGSSGTTYELEYCVTDVTAKYRCILTVPQKTTYHRPKVTTSVPEDG